MVTNIINNKITIATSVLLLILPEYMVQHLMVNLMQYIINKKLLKDNNIM